MSTTKQTVTPMVHIGYMPVRMQVDRNFDGHVHPYLCSLMIFEGERSAWIPQCRAVMDDFGFLAYVGKWIS